MRQNIESLLALQSVHLELDEVRAILNQAPDQLQEIRNKIEHASEEKQELESQLEELNTDHARLNTENQEESDRVNNYDKRLKTLKTNREYQALLREIGFARKLVAETDIEMKNTKEKIYATQERIQELGDAVSELESSSSGLEEEWSQSQTDMKAKAEELEKKEQELSKAVPRDVLSRYTLVRRRNPNAVVAVENGRCTGCNMAVPPQLFNRLLRGAEMLSCSSCSRILFPKIEEKEEDAE